MNIGEIIIAAVIRAAAIENAVTHEDGGWIFVWSANAAEQIEAALHEAGYTLCPNVKNQAREPSAPDTAKTE